MSKSNSNLIKTELNPHPNHKIIGHRGAGKLAPENTLSSFRKAKELGLNWIEFDIQPVYFSNTLEWVVLHDDTVNRTSNGKGSLTAFSLENLKKLDAGSWFHQEYSNEPIPLLSEALSLIEELNIHPNIEIKLLETQTHTLDTIQTLAESLITYIKQHWPSQKPFPLLSSFNQEILIALKKLSYQFQFPNEIPLGYLIEKYYPTVLDWVEENGLSSLHCDYSCVTDSNLEYLLSGSVPILLYTVNSSHLAQRYLNLGVSAIISDLEGLKIVL